MSTRQRLEAHLTNTGRAVLFARCTEYYLTYSNSNSSLSYGAGE